MERKDMIKDLKKFLQENYPAWQAFNTKNLVGDNMKTIYEKNGIRVDECKSWKYIEIFGLTDKEYKSLIDPDNWYTLKSFK